MFKFLIDNWKGYTIEFFLVILAITIPFLISKWISKIQDNRLGNQYKVMILDDLDEDLQLLKINLNDINSDRKSLIEFVENINVSGIENEKVLKNIIPRIVKYYHFIPSNSTFKDLESTGNMKLISDINARKSVFKYYRLATLINKMENAYEEETEGYLKPTILKHFPVRKLAQYDFLYKGNTRFNINVEEIENDVNFENAILIKIDLLNNLRLIYESLIQLNQSAAHEIKK